jgi:hypothetical protein
MFMHNKRLMYTVRVAEPNPALATLMLEQFGGRRANSPQPCATSPRPGGRGHQSAVTC